MMNTQQETSIPKLWPPFRRQADQPEVVERAHQCVNYLNQQGFEILTVQVTGRNTRVTIKPAPDCSQLSCAVRRFERTASGERRYWVAILFACEVRWMEDGGQP